MLYNTLAHDEGKKTPNIVVMSTNTLEKVGTKMCAIIADIVLLQYVSLNWRFIRAWFCFVVVRITNLS